MKQKITKDNVAQICCDYSGAENLYYLVYEDETKEYFTLDDFKKVLHLLGEDELIIRNGE